MRRIGLILLVVFEGGVLCRAANEPAEIPVGLDAYRQWDRWAVQRIGARAYLRSTYDQRGGNEGADASHFLYQRGDDFNVTLDLEGAGVLCFARYNHWHGSPWHYVVDGRDTIVRESSTGDPNHPVENSVFEPREVFKEPLAWTWSATRGADLSWVPVGFEKSFAMAYSRTHYGTGYYIYQRFVPGAKLSSPIVAWDGETAVDGEVLKTINDVTAGDWTPAAGKVATFKTSTVRAKQATTLAELRGPAVVRLLGLVTTAEVASRLRIRIIWDGREASSVDAPLPLFFGAGTLYNRDGREFLVKAFPVSVRYREGRVELACRFPMPFFRGAKIELVNEGEEVGEVACVVMTEPLDLPASQVGYFHATYRDHPTPKRGHDLVLLDTREIEGSRDWTGSFVGTSFIFSHKAVLNTLEGDPRFFFDDAQGPQGQGTGTEEWGGGGDYWGGRNMTLPFAGHPCGAPSAKEAKNELDKIESAYRFLLGDLFPFGKNARIQLEHGGTNESVEHYETVTYWYGLPGASMVKTDSLQVGDEASERGHSYKSPEASAPYSIASRFELGVNHLKGEEIYPEHSDVGRKMRGVSEFVMKLEPENFGVMLRRKLDYSLANQRAEVSVADVDGGEWKAAGVWYLAGSNTCVYSNPKEELGATQHVVQTSNRRFREDEFLLGRELTRGRKAIRVRVNFLPVERALFPGGPVLENTWSEIRYDAFCFVMPEQEK